MIAELLLKIAGKQNQNFFSEGNMSSA